MIEVQDLTKSYGHIRALRGVSFEVDRGQVIGLLGPNGAGKSTAMRILTGYVGASSGSARVDGIEVGDDPAACQRKIGYLPEGNPLYLDMRLIESLRFAAEMHGLRGAARDKAVAESVEMVGLSGKERLTIGTFSKGYRQRVGLAQALLHSPPILILDEPTSGLDPNQQEDMRRLIRRLGEERTIILSTHILPEVEASCGRALIINDGELVAEGTVEEIRAKAAGTAQVRVCVRGAADLVERTFAGLDFVENVVTTPAADGQRMDAVLGLRSEPDAALLEAVAQASVTAGMPLSGLAVDRASLETIFARLTGVDTGGPQAAFVPARGPGVEDEDASHDGAPEGGDDA